MYKSLMPEFLSINASLSRAIELAAHHGFAGVDTSSGHLLAPELELEAVQKQLAETGVRPGYVGLSPGRIPAPDADWQAALASLPEVARRAAVLGYRRAALVVLPFHETLEFEAAFAEMVRTINTVMAILDDFGIALGLEYISPLTRRAPYANHFIHELRGMQALWAAVDSPNVGLLLDTFHWHCAGETVVDLEALRPEQVVVVHLNDAPLRPRDEQTVGDRALPGTTGVIETTGFLDALRTIGYEGPITCEPMASAIASLPNPSEDAVLAQTSTALDAALRKRAPGSLFSKHLQRGNIGQ